MAAYDAILLDVDNGSKGLTRKENNALYSPAGLSTALSALQPSGTLGVWSISTDKKFSKQFARSGFKQMKFVHALGVNTVVVNI